MARAKKDAERITMNVDRQVMERLRAYADEKGQTVTTAVERLLTIAMDADEKVIDKDE